MKSTNTITQKIRLIGFLYIILTISIILSTTYMNSQTQKDALIINIAGKQRMLTQKVSKNVFYIYHNHKQSFVELDNATQEFIYNLDTLKSGNNLLKIAKAPTDKIANQIAKVEILWGNFYANVTKFKREIANRSNQNEKILKNLVDTVYNTNNNLLFEVDKIVALHTDYAENKIKRIQNIQYFFAVLMILLVIYSFKQLKAMHENAQKFLDYSKKIKDSSGNGLLEPIKFEAEKEIVEATDTLNCFITKINSAMTYSENASQRLEQLTDEFDKVLDELKDSKEMSNKLYRSEDMIIESQEKLSNFTNKLEELKKELNNLTLNCKNKST